MQYEYKENKESNDTEEKNKKIFGKDSDDEKDPKKTKLIKYIWKLNNNL